METLARELHIANAAELLDPRSLIFLNFNPALFTDPRATEAALAGMRRLLGRVSVAPSRIVCELTEQKSGSDAGLVAFVDAMKAEGYLVAVDDYGTLESDLARIDRLHPDIVKFDGKLVARLMDSSSGYALLTELATGFRARGIRTVFEGIEREIQIELAEKAGATMVQGYALARPALANASLRQAAYAPAATVRLRRRA